MDDKKSAKMDDAKLAALRAEIEYSLANAHGTPERQIRVYTGPAPRDVYASVVVCANRADN